MISDWVFENIDVYVYTPTLEQVQSSLQQLYTWVSTLTCAYVDACIYWFAFEKVPI